MSRDSLLALDAPHGSPWQGPFGEVVFDPLGEMLIAVVAFLMIEVPVVTDLVGNGMGQFFEFELWHSQSAVVTNALSLIPEIDAFAVRPKGVVADDVVVALEPLKALNQNPVDFRGELRAIHFRELRHWFLSVQTGPSVP